MLLLGEPLGVNDMNKMWLMGVGLVLCVGLVWAEDKPKRFDLDVREDLFAGFNGDAEALARGLKQCEEALQANPKHAEAMVWRGAARVFQAGELFQAKKVPEGFKLWNAGLKDMEEAVKLEPENVGVRIPRAAVLAQASRGAPAAMAKPLQETLLKDYQTIYAKQKDHLGEFGTHPKGELLMGLADAYRMLGEAEKSAVHLKQVQKELPDSKYAKRAEEWLKAKPDAKLVHNCIGCHTAK